jgi:hypothetical protein
MQPVIKQRLCTALVYGRINADTKFRLEQMSFDPLCLEHQTTSCSVQLSDN